MARLFQGTSGITQPARLLIRNEAEWRDVWTRLVQHASPAPDGPAIDFTKEMVIVAALGTSPTAGYMIHIAHIGRVSGVTYVEIISTSPASQCHQAERSSSPADVVVVPKTDEPLTFVETQVVRGC